MEMCRSEAMNYFNQKLRNSSVVFVLIFTTHLEFAEFTDKMSDDESAELKHFLKATRAMHKDNKIF